MKFSKQKNRSKHNNIFVANAIHLLLVTQSWSQNRSC